MRPTYVISLFLKTFLSHDEILDISSDPEEDVTYSDQSTWALGIKSMESRRYNAVITMKPNLGVCTYQPK